MAYQLDGKGMEADGVKFGLFVPTITEEALIETLGKCVSCKTWFTRVKSSWVEHQDGFLVEVCTYCAEDYYPEAAVLV